MLADLPGQSDELVGGVAHGGDNNHHVVALIMAAGDATGHVLDAFGIGQGAAAVLLDYQGHGLPILFSQ